MSRMVDIPYSNILNPRADKVIMMILDFLPASQQLLPLISMWIYMLRHHKHHHTNLKIQQNCLDKGVLAEEKKYQFPTSFRPPLDGLRYDNVRWRLTDLWDSGSGQVLYWLTFTQENSGEIQNESATIPEFDSDPDFANVYFDGIWAACGTGEVSLERPTEAGCGGDWPLHPGF